LQPFNQLFYHWLFSNQILQDIDTASQYLLYLFKAKLSVPDGGEAPAVPLPDGLSQSLMAEYELLATVLSKAYRSPSKVPSFECIDHMFMTKFQYLSHGV
jgi:hypothetical protein